MGCQILPARELQLQLERDLEREQKQKRALQLERKLELEQEREQEQEQKRKQELEQKRKQELEQKRKQELEMVMCSYKHEVTTIRIMDDEDPEEVLERAIEPWSHDGWELISVVQAPEDPTRDHKDYLLVLRKELISREKVVEGL
jgi:hypothetical protein